MVFRTDGMAVAPVATDLLERVTRTVPVEAVAIVDKYLHRPGVSKLTNAIGTAYEAYVGHALDGVLPGRSFGQLLSSRRGVTPRDATLC